MLDVGLVHLRSSGDISRVRGSATRDLRAAAAPRHRCRQEEGQFERLARQPRQAHELEKRDPLGVLIQHRPAVDDLFDPFAGPPARHGRERLAVWIMNIRPELEADRRTEMNPVDAAVGKQGPLGSDRLAGGEVIIVWRRGDLAN